MSALEKWLYFLRYVQDEKRQEKIIQIVEESEGLQMAYEVLQEVDACETLRAKLRFQEKAAHDRISEIVYAREEGKEEGREEGKKEGKKEGKEEKQLEIAARMMAMGLADEVIAQAVGLAADVVRELRVRGAAAVGK